jgi:hypothetical protein
MMASSSDPHRALIARAAKVFDQVLTDVEPYGAPQHLIALLLFRRLTEAQKECCDAILNLYDHNLFRPAYGILRTLYEHSAAQVWLHRNPIEHQWVLLNGHRPKMGRILSEIGWPDDSVAPYAETSRVAHPTIRSAYFSHDLNLTAEPVASWVTTRDFSSLAHHLLWDCAKLADEDAQQNRVYLALNTFDVMSRLARNGCCTRHLLRKKIGGPATRCRTLKLKYPDRAISSGICSGPQYRGNANLGVVWNEPLRL